MVRRGRDKPSVLKLKSRALRKYDAGSQGVGPHEIALIAFAVIVQVYTHNLKTRLESDPGQHHWHRQTRASRPPEPSRSSNW